MFSRLGFLWLVVLLAFITALFIGAQDYSPAVLWQAIRAYDPGDAAQVILIEMRLPRALTAVTVGAALAVSGLVMQALTRNPLADPGLTGVNAGAALAVVGGLWIFGPLPRSLIATLAITGAAGAVVLVRMLAGGGDNTLRLPLAGVAFASLCMAIVSFIVLLNPEARNVYRFWMVGSLTLADTSALLTLAPVVLVGIGCALLISRQIEALMLGTEMGTALGVSADRVLSVGLLSIALTAGASVALAGPVSFIGLIAPHLARRIVPRAGLAAQVLLACPMGACLALLADTAGRRLVRPGELPLSILLAAIGAPIFMLLVRRILRESA
ncbi:MAG: iron ABC transporter permease [Rhizobiaceae bacterium]|nr:iron ABC transporter permease [Rhizobiaceae bacterium]MBL4733546.1 iron ABC transporter permease [Rhizobiaceae bacterium]